MRNIKYIVVHCTATQPTATLEAIRKYWREVRKWGDTPGYHYLVKRNGFVENLLSEKKMSYGAHGHNAECVHVAYIGGIDEKGNPLDNRTNEQKQAIFDLLFSLSEKYPEAKILGHRDFPGVTKACPSFDVRQWLKSYVPDILTRQPEEGDEDELNLAA
jgi:N-acetylmuramoyl-L-alanine amidase